MKISRDEVARIAGLAALTVDERTLDELAEQLAHILDYVSQLSAVDTSGVEPFRPPSNREPQALRPDTAQRPDPPIAPGAFAPAFKEGLFLVPRVGGFDEEGS